MQAKWLATFGILALLIISLTLTAPLYAKPDFGDECTSCHTEGGITLTSNVTGRITVVNSSSFAIQISAEGEAEGLVVVWPSVANNPSFVFSPSTIVDNGPQDSDPLENSVEGVFEIGAPSLPASYSIRAFGAGSGEKGATLSFQVIVTSEGAALENLLPTAYFLHFRQRMTVEFEDRSWDLDGNIALWRWDFGDNTSSTEQNPVHTFSTIGTYTVTLTVTDDQGGSGLAIQTFTLPTEEERLTLWSLQVAIGSAVIIFTTVFTVGIATMRKKQSKKPQGSNVVGPHGDMSTTWRPWRL